MNKIIPEVNMPKKVSLEKQTPSTKVTRVRSFVKLLICLSEPIELEKRKRRMQGVREVAQRLFQELMRNSRRCSCCVLVVQSLG
jgi:hypothetical protein